MRRVLTVVASVAMAVWLIAVFFVADNHASEALCKGMRIEVSDTSLRHFVTAREIARELGTLPQRSAGMRLADINTEEIGRRLAEIDKIESANVVKLADGRVLVTVTPLLPVARVFDGSDSYYVNREGKRIRANARYFSDVPVITGHFPREDSVFTPLSLMPLFDWLNEHAETWGRFITMVKVESPNDVILIPAITGHVINIGAPEGFDSKFERLRKVYQKVIPLKGWKYYDTLSVKWAGQLVATRRSKPVEQVAAASDDEDETTDVSTMLAGEGVAPGQTKPGEKAHNDKPIPGAAAAEKPKKEDKPDNKQAKKESKKDNKKSKNTQH